MNIKYILLVGIVSFIGGIFRFLVSVIIKQHFSYISISFVLSTFIINIIGCLGIGLLYEAFYKQALTMHWVLFACVGIMGGFPTFSAFSSEIISLFLNKQIIYAIVYIASSITIGLFFTYIGFLITK
ncbi:MAG: fluoride efflux transporter FluC [Chitinophagaceae bacterium]